MTEGVPSTERRWGLELARAGALVPAVAMHALWVLSLVENWSTPEMERRDYRVFWDAGRRVLEDDLPGIYSPRPGGFPFLHPPPVITLSAPLGLLSIRGAYLALSVAAFAALALSIRALHGLAPSRREHDLVWLLVLASAPWFIALVLGQPAALFLAAWLLGLWALRCERPVPAGVAFGLLLLKPPLALAPLAFLLVTRRWRALGATALTLAALVLVSLPAGLSRWPEWLAAVARVTAEVGAARVALWKQHTFLAWLLTVVPRVAWIGWTAVALPLGAATLRAASRRSILGAGALLALATVALAPYAYFYDALLLALPLASLLLEPDAHPRRWRIAIACAAGATFVSEHVAFFALQRGPAVPGLLVTVWLALELLAPAGSERSSAPSADLA